MKKQKSIKELLILLRNNEELFKDYLCTGLCVLSRYLWEDDIITLDEFDLLKEYIETYRPTKGKHYGESKKFSGWYWTCDEWPPREAWLDDEIKKQK